MKEVVIVSAVRTPIGSFQGALAGFTAPQLGALVIKEAVNRAGIKPEDVSEVIMGNVLPAGEGQAPARQAAIYAGLPKSTPCMTINKVCGSGLKAVMLAAQAIIAGDAEIVVAGGMESMSNVPYYLPKARTGYRMGNGTIIDGMVHDGLWDCYNNYHMGSAGELCAKEMNIPRKEQDDFSVESYTRALNAIEKGLFNKEIVAVEIKDKKGSKIVAEDEEPKKTNFEKGLALRPAFDKEGSITAFNASKINDGASALVIMSREKADSLGIKPLAKIIAQTSFAQEPEWFTTAPAYAIENVVKKANMKLEDIDIFEINEAFASVVLAWEKELHPDMNKVNVNGGAIALGHPLGASGTRLMTTLLNELERTGGRYGLQTMCEGGGMANATIIERLG